jgi:hypothetical protein
LSTADESVSGRIGLITLDEKQTGKRNAGNPHVAFDVAGVGNVAMVAGMRASAKVLASPPGPTARAPVLDPTDTRGQAEDYAQEQFDQDDLFGWRFVRDDKD